MKLSRKIAVSFFFVVAVAILVSSLFLGLNLGVTAYASSSVSNSESTYSNVLTDLTKDPSFDIRDFPADQSDYSISLIQIAESVNGELFVYVYQPAKTKVTAKSINISTADTGSGETLRYYNYKLRLLNSSGVFFKYKVQNLSVSSEAKRFYDISNILRGFISGVDEDPGNDNTISEVGYEVARIFCCETKNGKVTMTCLETETIEVTDKFVGFVRYLDGFQFFEEGACDSHFIAFSTDKDIDHLYEADVSFTVSTYYKNEESYLGFVSTNEGFTDERPMYVYLDEKQSGTYTGSGIGASTFSWDRIETPDDFFSDNGVRYSGVFFNVSEGVELTSAAREEIENKQWILRFYESPVSVNYVPDYFGVGSWSRSIRQTCVNNTLILRLKFETDGVVYNLGVVDCKQTGSSDPVNKGSHIEVSPGFFISEIQSWFESVKDVLKWVLIAIAGVLVLIVLGGIISWIVKIVERSERAKVARQYRERKRK